jgi:hypothetical protein
MYRVKIFHGYTLDEEGDTRYFYKKNVYLFGINIFNMKVIDYRGEVIEDTSKKEERPMGFQFLPSNIINTE